MKPIIGITPSAQLDTLAHGTFLALLHVGAVRAGR